MTTETEIKGMVLYSDGGARPNPGFGGAGIHGYLYSATPMNKGVGRNFEITSQGYFDKSDKDQIVAVKEGQSVEELLNEDTVIAVTPLKYIDITHSIPGNTSTNNTAELIAATRAIRYSMDYDVKYLTVLTDSDYTRNGANQWVEGWIANNWIKNDGSTVSNHELWKDLVATREAAEAKGIRVSIGRVPGHSGEVGNDRADMLASMGVFDAQRSIFGETIEATEADGYWKNTVNRHPFIAHRRCYFSSQSAFAPGVYHLGDHGKDDELLGKRASDGCYSVVQLEEPDTVLELLRRHQASLSGASNSIFAMHLDQIYGVDQYKSIDLFGERSFTPPNGYRLDIKHADKTPLTREFKPAMLAARSIEQLSNLEVLLDKFNSDSPDLTKHEITSYFYDLTEKKIPPKKGQSEGTIEVATKLKPEIVVGLAEMTVKAKLPSDGPEQFEDLKLTLGIDILDRNSLKRLEGLRPHIYLVTWSVSDTAYRYATIIKAGGSTGIWCGVYSNLRVVSSKPAAA